MDTKPIKTKFVRTMHIMVILAVVFSVSTVANAAPASPFIGQWQATDVDGSDIRLTIAGRPEGPFQITWTESYIGFCDGEAGIVRGTGWLNENDPNLLEADLHLECFTTGATLDFYLVWRYHPATNRLSSRYDNGTVTIWNRPGRPSEPPPVLDLRINYGHDWVESFYEGGHIAWITVTESDGVTVKATAELVTEPKDYWGGETGFQSLDSIWFDSEGNPMENPPDILPNDWVFGWVDNGASAQVQIGDISGTIDLANDSISGAIYAPWFTDPVQVECIDWGSGQEPPFDNKDGGFILTDGADPYSCSWMGEWDIQPGQNIGVGYFGPDGHWVANAFYVPKMDLRVNYGHDWVESFYEGGHTVQIAVTESDGVTVKATAELVTEPKDFWGGETGFQTNPEDWVPAQPDIQPYDWVFAQVDNGASAQVQIGDMSGIIDLEADSIGGTINAPWFSDEVVVECHSWGAPLPEEILKYDTVLPDGVDTYSCSWFGEWDIQPGQDVGVGYFGFDGHWVANAFFEPATILVNSTDDVLGDDGACTLREAVIAANTNSQLGGMEGECPAGLDFQTDTIVLAADQTYSLTIDSTYENDSVDGDLDVWDNSAATDLIIMVEGNGEATISQDASVDDRVLENHGAAVRIEGLTLTGGYEGGIGGGVLNHGSLNMAASEVSGNTADWSGGGIFNSGTGILTVDSSAIINNTATNGGGGGITNQGSLTLTNSTLSGNISTYNDGGGIANSGVLMVDASILSGNSAPGSGGGALANFSEGTTTIQNGTEVSGNSSGTGGGLFNYGNLTVFDSSVSSNYADYGGGLSNWAGILTLNNSTVTGNTSANDGGGIHNTGFATTVIENGSVISGNTSQWNGGGLANWDDGTVTISNSTVSNNTTGGGGGGLSNHNQGMLTVESSTISGNSSTGGGGIVNWGAALEVFNSTISDNTSAWGGGIATEGGTLTLDASTVSGNTSDNDAGGIFVRDFIFNDADGNPVTELAIVNIQNGSQITNNTAAWGGGISSWNSTLTIDASVISNNTVTNSGGGLLIHDGGMAFIQNGSVISGNIAQWEGGISNWGGSTLTIDSSTISNNTASGSSGGIGNLGTMTLNASTVSGNSAPWGGGLFNVSGASMTISNSIISGNSASGGGGGLLNVNGTVTVTGSAILANTSPGDGDAIYIYTDIINATTVTNSCIISNGSTAVFNEQSVSQDFTGNWWGHASGPSGVGPGSGDSISDFVEFSGWLTEPPSICAP